MGRARITGTLIDFFKTTATGIISVVFPDAGAPPTETGELLRHGADVKWHDGTAVRTVVSTDATQALSNKTISVTAGSPSAPSVAFTNAGFYSSGTSKIGVAANAVKVGEFAPASVNLGKNGFEEGGLSIRHIACGLNAIDAHVQVFGDETYVNTAQEVRGVSVTVRNKRTTADEPTLGWDFFGLIGSVVVDAGNTQFIRGQQKGVVAELHFQQPTTGSYTVNTAFNFQAAMPTLGSGVTVSTWYGLVINNPTGAGTITTGYGIRIEALTKPTTAAAIRLDGTGTAGRIQWPNTFIQQNPDGRLVLGVNSLSLVIANAATAATATAGAGQALPGQVTEYLIVNVLGNDRKIPLFAP
jgi:hypothetical protein